MKKQKIKISPEMMKSSEKMRADVNARMAMSEAERYKDEHCVGLVPCCICKAEGDVIRKSFVPFGYEAKLKTFGHTETISICARCIKRLFEDDLIKSIISRNELKELR